MVLETPYHRGNQEGRRQVEQLERLVVHVEEAIRLGSKGDPAHLRLGLMLLDSAAELLMHRECEYLLHWDSRYRWLLERAQRDHDDEIAAELAAKVISLRRRERVERYFDPKCDYLRDNGILADAQARVLKKLHKYRNETYHSDDLRPDTLASSARIYIYLVCTMMRDFPVHVVMSTGPRTPAGLRAYVDLVTDRPPSLELQEAIAIKLLEDSGVGNSGALGRALAEHLAGRLDDLEDRAGFAASFFRDTRHDASWDLDAILAYVQVPEPSVRFQLRSGDQAKANPGRVRARDIARWRRSGASLAAQTDDLTAFARFADIEDDFEPTEALIASLARRVDDEIQEGVDRLRGK